MSATPAPGGARSYDPGFVRWVYQNIEGADRIALCMQCGTCSGSCPIGTAMDHGPRKLIMMIRSGMRDAVFSSNTLWNCTQCYNCVVRCPRKVPVTNILQGLAAWAAKEGYAPRQPTARFAKAFWTSLKRFGRTDERLVTMLYYLSHGLKPGLELMRKNLPIARGMLNAKRMHLGLPHRIRRPGDLRAILAETRKIEQREQAERPAQ